MGERVSYECSEGVSTIAMDDGKVNAMSVAMMQELNAALDQAEEQRSVVILTGREGVLSGGFDLAVFKQGMEPLMEMLRVGAGLLERLLTFPYPVVMACTGHAIAMGSFLLMSTDARIGADGPFKIGMNEVAVGMTLPYFAVELARHRLTPAQFDRATILAEMYSPQDSISPGFLDRVVPPEELLGTAAETAAALTKLDIPSHAATKLRVRGTMLEAFRQAIASELA